MDIPKPRKNPYYLHILLHYLNQLVKYYQKLYHIIHLLRPNTPKSTDEIFFSKTPGYNIRYNIRTKKTLFYGF